jgi:hypothetical protein
MSLSPRVLNFIRKWQLVGNGLTFAGFAIASIVNLHGTADFYGYTLNGVGGENEFRAVYMGFWFGLTLLFLTSVRYYHLAILGDMALTLTLFQALGRLVSFALDGIPPTQFVVFFWAELLSAGVGLLIRPQPETPREPAATPAPA